MFLCKWWVEPQMGCLRQCLNFEKCNSRILFTFNVCLNNTIKWVWNSDKIKGEKRQAVKDQYASFIQETFIRHRLLYFLLSMPSHHCWSFGQSCKSNQCPSMKGLIVTPWSVAWNIRYALISIPPQHALDRPLTAAHCNPTAIYFFQHIPVSRMAFV